MKKTLLLLIVVVFSAASFAQVDLQTIEYTTEDPSTTTTYNFNATFAGTDGNIFVPLSDYNGGTRYWDLSDYAGLEFDLECDASDVGNSLVIRIVAVGDGGAWSYFQTATVESTNVKVVIDFAGASFPSNKVWGIKSPSNWHAEAADVTITNDVTVNGIYALTSIPTSIDKEVQIQKDPSRLVNVYSLTGSLVRSNVKYNEATNGLKTGIYIVDGEKMYVRK